MNNSSKPSIIAILALLIVPFDFMYFTFCLPLLQKQLNIPIYKLYWIINAPFLSLVIASAICTQLTLRYSLKKMMALALTLYALSPLLFFLKLSFSSIILIRVLQGLALSLLIPSTLQALIDHSKFKFWILPIAPLLAIILTLFATPHLYWPWIFAIPAFCAALFILGTPFIKHDARQQTHSDYLGAIFSGLIFGIIFLGFIAWAYWSIGISIMIFFFAFLILQLTFYFERKLEHPLLQFRIFKDKFSLTTLIPLYLFQFTLWPTLILIILYIVAIKDLHVIYLAIPLLVFATAIYLGSLLSLSAYKKKLVKSCMTLALFLASSSTFLISLIFSKSSTLFISLPLALLGFSYGILYLNSNLQAKLIFSKPLLLKGFIFYETLQYLAASSGLTIGLYLFIKNFKIHFDRLLEMSGNPYNGPIAALFLNMNKSDSLLFSFKKAFISACSYGLHTVTASFAWILFLTLIFSAVFTSTKTTHLDH